MSDLDPIQSSSIQPLNQTQLTQELQEYSGTDQKIIDFKQQFQTNQAKIERLRTEKGKIKSYKKIGRILKKPAGKAIKTIEKELKGKSLAPLKGAEGSVLEKPESRAVATYLVALVSRPFFAAKRLFQKARFGNVNEKINQLSKEQVQILRDYNTKVHPKTGADLPTDEQIEYRKESDDWYSKFMGKEEKVGLEKVGPSSEFPEVEPEKIQAVLPKIRSSENNEELLSALHQYTQDGGTLTALLEHLATKKGDDHSTLAKHVIDALDQPIKDLKENLKQLKAHRKDSDLPQEKKFDIQKAIDVGDSHLRDFEQAIRTYNKSFT